MGATHLSGKRFPRYWSRPTYRATVARLLMGVSIVLLATSAHAQTADSSTETVAITDAVVGGPYCGLYSIQGAFNALEKSVDFKTLLNPKYVGSPEGSSLGELKAAAEDHGLYAVPMTRMTAEDLKRSPWPIILHVSGRRGFGANRRFDHWVLYLGADQGNARIVEPPQPLEHYTFAQLLVRWNGTGLVVADRPIDLTVLRRGQQESLATIAFAAFAIVIAVHLGRRSLPDARASAARLRSRGLRIGLQALGLAAVSSCIALGYHALDDEGILSNQDAVNAVTSMYCATFLPNLTVDEVVELVNQHRTAIVDARTAASFRKGSIPGAINIPVNSDPETRAHALSGVAKDARIVVFCQSRGCNYDMQVVGALMADGFTNLSLFRGGYVDWHAVVDGIDSPLATPRASS